MVKDFKGFFKDVVMTLAYLNKGTETKKLSNVITVSAFKGMHRKCWNMPNSDSDKHRQRFHICSILAKIQYIGILGHAYSYNVLIHLKC